jgi:hypothetical protein
MTVGVIYRQHQPKAHAEKQPHPYIHQRFGRLRSIRDVHPNTPQLTLSQALLYTVCMAKKLTAVRLKPEQLKKLEKIAVREDLPVSWLIRKAIDEYLKHHK